MPKIILTSRYLRDAPPAQLENYVRYVSTREGVEKVEGSRQNLPATIQQKDLIRQIVCDIPSAKEILEYTDFLLRPTMGNASEFISCALEQNVDLIGNRENYVDYIANRPRVERLGEHGLFTDAGKAVVLKQVQEEAAAHKGPVWTHVISLRREDAARLGYDSAAQWMALLRSKRAMLCKHMKIDSASLRWYAAFHNEGNHPHVHLMVYSAKDNDGYLTEKSIEAMRLELAHDIFRQDFAHIYEKQNQTRTDLKKGATDVVQEMMDALRRSTVASAEIEKMMVRLAERLQNTGGKKVYGYLKRDVKNLIDRIVDELAKEEKVDALYRAWGKWQDELLLTYRNSAPPLPPLYTQPQFKSLKNMIIAEAVRLGSDQFFFEDEGWQEQEERESLFPDGAELPDGEGTAGQFSEDASEPFSSDAPEPFPKDVPDWHMEDADRAEEPDNRAAERESLKDDGGSLTFYAEWNKNYKQARRYLYGSGNVVQDFVQACSLFRQEAEAGNALAMHDLGRMCADGLGQDADQNAAQEWYAKALEAFHGAEKEAKERKHPYLQYRIGKMYAAGLGAVQDYGTAAGWLSLAAAAGHKYAQYSLAGLYHRGQGVAQDDTEAFRLYGCSAEQGNPYADYELAKMYRDGTGTLRDSRQADICFQNAFSGFLRLEEKSGDDRLQYRLGQMLHTGTGTERDDDAAAAYWERAAKLGNVHAQYALGKLWLETGEGNTAQAVRWITKAAETGNAAAQYTLGKLCLFGEVVERDAARAVELFTLSAGQGNDYAAYRLGRLYLSGDDFTRDEREAARWLEQSANQGNQYAQYALGKLYLSGADIPKDVERAVCWLGQSAYQGNQYAQYALGKLYLSGEDIPKDVERAVHWLEQSVGQGNQYAQYALGKLYLCGKDVPRDREKAAVYLQVAAEQGNIYAAFLLEHMDSFRDPDLFLAATRLMHRLEKLLREDVQRAAGGGPFHIDRKRRRRLEETGPGPQEGRQGACAAGIIKQNGGVRMAGFVYFTDEQKQRANEVDLEDFLSRRGEKLLRSGREKRLASDHSITVRGNRWYDHASETGGCAIDFVQMHYNSTFPEAVILLLGGEQGQAYRASEPEREKEPKPFALPEANGDMRRAYAYLTKSTGRRGGTDMQPVVILILIGAGMISVIGGISLLSHYYTLNGIKSRTVGDGQHGTARFATEKEIRETYAHVPYEPEKWRRGENLPTAQGLVVGYKKQGAGVTALVDEGDIHCLMIGAAGVGKTANFLYPNIEYACASGMSFVTTDTKGDLFRNYAGMAKEHYGYRISILDLRNPTRSDGGNILTMVNKYMDEYLADTGNLAAKARAEKYAQDHGQDHHLLGRRTGRQLRAERVFL